VEELRTVITIVGVGAEDCLVVDTFGFNFANCRFALWGKCDGQKTAARWCGLAGRGVILWRWVCAIIRWLENCGFA